uniref:sphingomyelin phosphodiesterase n=1 Tax=Bubo bubo TaxID=30461 RepID=A0A8C0F0V7_BUBBB
MEGDPTLRLRVFDLNCWAIRYLSKRRQERVRLIGNMLRREGFDLVLLQEVWSEQDYSDLKVKLGGCYPFSHYFRSGVIGSGLCVFSRFPILDTLLYQYSLNGYPYMLQHGDWFCGKSVGLVIIKISGIIFNVYVTHLHAEYCREKDAYLPHRLVQAWELRGPGEHPEPPTHPDAPSQGCEDGCTLVPNNCFTVKTELLPFPLGIRIDYILYKAISSFTVKCEELKTTTGTAPGMDIPFSDHEAVMATLHIQRQGRAAGATLSTAGKVGGCWWGPPCASRPLLSPPELTLADVVTEARTEVGVFLAIGVLLLATGLHLFHTIEVKMLQGTEEQMRMALRALQERPSDS